MRKVKGRIIEQYELWDIPNTMINTFKEIVKKHQGKPIVVTVWDYEEKKKSFVL